MRHLLLLAAALPALAGAQTRPPTPGEILVSASGSVRTPPDMATIGFTLRGEGATSDEAVAKLRDAGTRVSKGVASLTGGQHRFHSQQFQVAEVRGRECQQGYGQAQLSTGACAVIGYVATLPVTVDTARIADAGTLAGLVSRLGGTDVRVQSFWLRDDRAARAGATAAALANARAQAELIAQGGGGRLGALLRVQDGDYHEIGMDLAPGSPVVAPPAPPPPPPPPPPVQIGLEPPPIETSARLMVVFQLAR